MRSPGNKQVENASQLQVHVHCCADFRPPDFLRIKPETGSRKERNIVPGVWIPDGVWGLGKKAWEFECKDFISERFHFQLMTILGDSVGKRKNSVFLERKDLM